MIKLKILIKIMMLCFLHSITNVFIETQNFQCCFICCMFHVKCEFQIRFILQEWEKKTCYIRIPTNYCILVGISFFKIKFKWVLALGISWNIQNSLGYSIIKDLHFIFGSQPDLAKSSLRMIEIVFFKTSCYR